MPALSLDVGLLAQEVNASARTGDVIGPPLPSPGLRPRTALGHTASSAIVQSPVADTDLLQSPVIGTDLEVMTPRFVDTLGRPRGFVHVGLALALPQEHQVARVRAPGEYALPPGSYIPPVDFDETQIVGQGSAVLTMRDRLLVTAGAGLAFTADWGERRIRIKPSIEYLRSRVSVQGFTQRAVDLNDGALNGTLASFRRIILTQNASLDLHGLGPGIEVEADARSAGPLMLTVYANMNAYAWLNDTSVQFQSQNGYGETAMYSFDTQKWTLRAAAGLRFRWVGY